MGVRAPQTGVQGASCERKGEDLCSRIQRLSSFIKSLTVCEWSSYVAPKHEGLIGSERSRRRGGDGSDCNFTTEEKKKNPWSALCRVTLLIISRTL